MKAAISTTFNDQYLFHLPIVTFCWNKLGVDVICFLPRQEDDAFINKTKLVLDTMVGMKIGIFPFDSPKDKQVTYSQCSRLYAACIDLPEDEMIVTSDVDMAVFKLPIPVQSAGGMYVWGADLTPDKQYPICYLSGSVKDWRDTFELHGKTYQECLDNLLGHIEALEFRGNYWSKDQEESFNKISQSNHTKVSRSNGQNKFAQHRVDRTDDYWKNSLNMELFDAHLWRPGYDEINFNRIMDLMWYAFPNEDFTWLIEYRRKYLELL